MYYCSRVCWGIKKPFAEDLICNYATKKSFNWLYESRILCTLESTDKILLKCTVEILPSALLLIETYIIFFLTEILTNLILYFSWPWTKKFYEALRYTGQIFFLHFGFWTVDKVLGKFSTDLIRQLSTALEFRMRIYSKNHYRINLWKSLVMLGGYLQIL